MTRSIGGRRGLQTTVAATLLLAALRSAAQDVTASDPLVLRPSRELASPNVLHPGVPGPPGSPPAPGRRTPAPSTGSTPPPSPQATGGAAVAKPGGPAEERGALFLRADLVEGNEQRVEASGKVELRTQRETVLADWLAYDVTTGEIEGRGNVVLRRGTDFVTGPAMKFRRGDQTGFFDQPQFQAGELGGRGDAGKITFLGEDRYRIDEARYTTCAAPREDWFLESRELTLDNDRKVGVGRDTMVRFMGAPLIYTPYIEFPLSNQRKSGFLTPTAGSSGTRGLEFAIPYYFNLAPNYDATVTPRIMTKRGLQLGGQFRYLFNDPQPMSGETDVDVLPNDRQANRTRWLVATRHTQTLGPGWTGYWNVNSVSDDTYFADLADRVQVTSQTTLPRDLGVAFSRGPFAMLARVQNFQTLQDPNAPITPPYNRLPQVLATVGETEWAGLTWSGMTEYANFRQSQLQQGERGVLYPQAAWIRQTAAGFFVARGSIHLRQYDLDNPPPGTDAHPSFAIPIGSIDTGLTFERDTTIFDHRFVQTLEPRAFYVYIPYRNQSNLPVFDTTTDDFSFSQLFSENRYVGNDLIGDADQLTLAVSSRLLDPNSGAERLRATIGQRFYFRQQRVTLPGEKPRSASSSDVLLGFEGRLSEQWSLNGLLEQNLDNGSTERVNAGVRWIPGPGKALNAVWRYTSSASDPGGSELKQFDIATEWPLGGRWTALGRWNYSFADSRTLEAIAGVEYNADCWVLRIVLHRLQTTTQQATRSVYVQLELNGLARIGTSPLELLRRGIPGYTETSTPLRVSNPITPYPEF